MPEMKSNSVRRRWYFDLSDRDMKPFYLYMLRWHGQSFYIGHTDNLERRLAEHQEGICGGYTATRRPVELVFMDEFCTRDETIERERQLKGWSHAKKEALIHDNWEEICRLARRYGVGKIN